LKKSLNEHLVSEVNLNHVLPPPPRLCDFPVRHLKSAAFEELRIPVRVIASDPEEGKARIFDKGELIPAVAASCCSPVVFAPIQIGGHYYVDGGIFSKFPVSAIRDRCETLPGVNVSPLISMKYRSSVKYVLDGTMSYTIGADTIAERRKCVYLIESSEFSGYSTFELEGADEIYNLGTQLTTAYLDANREKTFNKVYEWLKPSPFPESSFNRTVVNVYIPFSCNFFIKSVFKVTNVW
jgi:predicted acylesterase/phospholipase RssA